MKQLRQTLLGLIVLACCCGSLVVFWPALTAPSETVSRPPTRRATATYRPSPTAQRFPQVTVKLNRVNIRSGPGTQYEAIDTAVEHETFDVIATNETGDWFNIRLPNGRRGWIGSSVVLLTGSLRSVNVAATVPASAPVIGSSGGSSHPTGTSGRCKDGTYTSANNRQGTCSHHGGIASWWGK